MAEYDTACTITHVCRHFERGDIIAQGKRLTSIFKIAVKNKQTNNNNKKGLRGFHRNEDVTLREQLYKVTATMVTLKFLLPTRDSAWGQTQVDDAGRGWRKFNDQGHLDDGNSVKWNNTVHVE